MYESQHDLFHEIPGEGTVDVLEFWFVVGVVMVALDTLRRKTDTETGVWVIAAIWFGLPVMVWGVDFAMRTFETIRSGVTGSGLSYVISLIMWIPAVSPLPLTTLLGTPIYALFLTVRALRAWRAYLRPA